MKKHYRKENDCLNCGTILEGKFCPNCGQENLQMKESFGHMLIHAVSDYFHFDDQFFQTLKPLLFEPGKLTNKYVAGRRAHYLHPVKMYIFISLVFFLIFFQNKKNDLFHERDVKQSEQTSTSKTKKAIDKGTDQNPELSEKQKKGIKRRISPFIPDTLRKEILADIKKDSLKKKSSYGSKSEDFAFFSDDPNDTTYSGYLARQSKLPTHKRDGALVRYLVKNNIKWRSHGTNAKEIITEGLKHNAPKMMFLLLPLFALILKLAFWNNHKFYVEHMIYAIHLHCFVFLYLTFTTLLALIVPDSWDGVMGWVGIISTIIINWYIYRSFRVVYKRSRWRTVSKLIGVGIMYSVLFGFCFVLMLLFVAITAA
ncbi:DUF3667 domain-containing protein [Mucilaginibacter glaciei]|uniref:DUF3667 domain-containing protein n=1 Tax=Mucilaginibacter glaciei TaxID=2772109 RepID=A0A926NPF9_9SPHI|nr:DUF3667 domain-containing protein [Mucilaginibacter glaciei]MBD1392257.1 DUF3667 domain-containing protein [Mucilaginibacter glaciei]